MQFKKTLLVVFLKRKNVKWLKTENGDDTTFEHITSVTAHKRLKNIQQVLWLEYRNRKNTTAENANKARRYYGIFNAELKELNSNIKKNVDIN